MGILREHRDVGGGSDGSDRDRNTRSGGGADEMRGRQVEAGEE